MIAGALVLPPTTVGMIEASTTRNVDALDPQPGIDHRRRIAVWAHFTGSDRVILRISTVTNILLQTGGIVDRVGYSILPRIQLNGLDSMMRC